jgi:hypothetical protein
MKKFSVLFTTFTLLLLAFRNASIVGAQLNIPSPSTRFTTHVNLVGKVVSLIIVYATVIAGLWFFVRLLIAGFNFMTSYGDPAKIDKARFDLLYATIGLVVVVSVFFVGQIIQVMFGINII